MPIPKAVVAITTLNFPFGSQKDFNTFSFMSTLEALVYISTKRNSDKSGYPGGNVKCSVSFERNK
jgi:hypothetical protein